MQRPVRAGCGLARIVPGGDGEVSNGCVDEFTAVDPVDCGTDRGGVLETYDLDQRPRSVVGGQPGRLALDAELGGERPVAVQPPLLRRAPEGLGHDTRLQEVGDYEWVVPHTFRKTAATRLDEAGCTARQIADHLGHARPSTTQDLYMGRGVACAEAARVL